MKSRTKPALRVVPAPPVQLSLNVQGVLADVRHAFYGLCVAAGKQVLAAMMEADRQGAWAARPMIATTASRPKCLAGGGPLERRVRPSHRPHTPAARGSGSAPSR
jgi:hypothetical protein